MKYLTKLLVALSAVACVCLAAWQLGGNRPSRADDAVKPATPETHATDTHRRRRPRQLEEFEAARVIGEKATVGGPIGPGGREVQVDLPYSSGLRLKNVGGRDGAGLCVFSSITMACRYALERAGWNFQIDMRKEPGGGYPGKVDAMIGKYCKGMHYLQYEGKDPAILDACLQSGRMASVTYGYGERYGSTIAHMVNLVHFDSECACVLDNNFIGEEQLEWMSRTEFLRRWKLGDPRGYGWVVVILRPGPPPIPWNKK